MINLLATSLPKEASPECGWQQAYLLSRYSDTTVLKACWDQLIKKENPSSSLILATALIGVKAEGVSALSSIHQAISAPNKENSNFFETQVIGMLGAWLLDNTNVKNHQAVLEFTRWQQGRLREEGLSAVSRYVVLGDLPIITDIFLHEEDPRAQYACIQSLGTLYEMTSTIPTYSVFMQKRDALVAQWKKIIQSPPAP